MTAQQDIFRLQKEMAQLRVENSLKKKPKSRTGYVLGFYVMLFLFLSLGVYTTYFITVSKEQVVKLTNSNNSLQDEKNNINSSLQSYKTALDQANNTIKDQNAKLSQKPTTVYVPQQSSNTYRAPSRTNCIPNFGGGFSCSTY